MFVEVTTVPGAGGASTLTTALGFAWPAPVIALEADPAGGVLAGWLDLPETPGLATAVTDPAAAAGEWPAIYAHLQTVTDTLSVLVAPVRGRDAAIAVGEAARLMSTIAGLADVHGVVDTGRNHPVSIDARVSVVVCRQWPGCDRATAIVIERVAALTGQLRAVGREVIVAVIGERPYPLAEIERYVGTRCVPIADDPAAALQLASGNIRPKTRLMRTAAVLAGEVQRLMTAPVGSGAVR